MEEEKDPLLMAEVRSALIVGKVASVVEFALDGVISAVTMTDPENTPTTLIMEVSVISRRAARLLMKVVMVLLLLKKVLMSMAK